jgi:hypothetical protein
MCYAGFKLSIQTIGWRPCFANGREQKEATSNAKSSYTDYKLSLMVVVLTRLLDTIFVTGGASVFRERELKASFFSSVATHGHIS